MANRNDSDVRQHETLPGPGLPAPGSNSSLGVANGMRPVEQMVDVAIERIAREHEQREEARGSKGGTGHALAVSGSRDDQLAVRMPKRLRWKGLDVSDEFRSYAERIARGEDLPPFEGRVLAEPNPAFPWGAPTPADTVASVPAPEQKQQKGRGSRIALWSSAAVVVVLLGGSLALKFEARKQPAALAESSASGVVAPASAVSPHDVVETPALEPPAADDGISPRVAASEPLNPEPLLSEPPALHAAVAQPSSEAAVSAPASPGETSPLPPAQPAPPAPTRAVGSAPAVANAGNASVAPSRAAPATQLTGSDDFGISAPVGSAPTAASAVAPSAVSTQPVAPALMTPAQAPGQPAPVAAAPAPAPSPAPAGAPVSGNVGDLARAGQALPGAVRKEPGSESSAKGSLLVEDPSF